MVCMYPSSISMPAVGKQQGLEVDACHLQDGAEEGDSGPSVMHAPLPSAHHIHARRVAHDNFQGVFQIAHDHMHVMVGADCRALGGPHQLLEDHTPAHTHRPDPGHHSPTVDRSRFLEVAAGLTLGTPHSDPCQQHLRQALEAVPPFDHAVCQTRGNPGMKGGPPVLLAWVLF